MLRGCSSQGAHPHFASCPVGGDDSPWGVGTCIISSQPSSFTLTSSQPPDSANLTPLCVSPFFSSGLADAPDLVHALLVPWVDLFQRNISNCHHCYHPQSSLSGGRTIQRPMLPSTPYASFCGCCCPQDGAESPSLA